jgi:hypothetical protein
MRQHFIDGTRSGKMNNSVIGYRGQCEPPLFAESVGRYPIYFATNPRIALTISSRCASSEKCPVGRSLIVATFRMVIQGISLSGIVAAGSLASIQGRHAI